MRIDRQQVPTVDSLLNTDNLDLQEGRRRSCSSTSDEFCLPNLDGANDSSSSEEERKKGMGAPKKSKKYKPLVFRPSNPKVVVDHQRPSTSAALNSPNILNATYVVDDVTASTSEEASKAVEVIYESQSSEKNELGAGTEPQEENYSDALFTMSFLSPQSRSPAESPPRPGTPNRIESACVVIRPLLEDMASYESSSGLKLQLSGRVLLKSLEDEVEVYQRKSNRKLHLPPDLQNTAVKCQSDLKRKHIEQAICFRKKSKLKNKQTASVVISSETAGKDRDTVQMKRIVGGRKEEHAVQLVSADVTENQFIEEIDREKIKELVRRSIEDEERKRIEKELRKQIEVEVRQQIEQEIRKQLEMQETAIEGKTDELELKTIDRNRCNEPKLVSDEDEEEKDEFVKQIAVGSQQAGPGSSLIERESENSSCDSSKTWNMFSSEDSRSFSAGDCKTAGYSQHCLETGTIYIPSTCAPSRECVISTMLSYGIPSTDNGTPFWSDANDEVKIRDTKGKFLSIGSRLVRSLPEFEPVPRPQVQYRSFVFLV